MSASDHRAPIAVLGPTNTGKTHLAIERMCAHSSGMIGFPLRLLAREVYDRVAAIKGKDQVALITGEERIAPPGARWLLCTAESMPLDRDVAFVALDEAQLGADPERGHVFTERILHARGRDETMLLGSDALRPILRTLVPQAEIISRPRFSTLTHAGAVKLSRLPPRSAIVAFSAEEVYAVAEMLRRMRGGAAVVMGSLSPQTRNAQVAMFQAGEVDYLVATDAVGMGLNMDVAHVAFASLRKFDGRRQRRLTIAEMAQIAGRAGRHQRDGTFGTLAHDGGARAVLEEDEIAAIEQHRFPPLDHLRWREGRPRLGSIDALIEDLERKPDRAGLRAAPQTIDLAVLKRLAEEPWVRERARGSAMVGRLWAACGLPDFRKTGAEAHARLVGRLFRHLSEGTGRMPVPWFAEEVARLESVQGDVETLADRIAGIRTWSYIAHRADWLADPETWAERTRQIETRLSDALHQRLTQRFVDRRTSVLMRDLGARGIDALPVRIAEDGEVSVGGEPIGRLDGFRFTVDPDARLQDKKRLLAAAERRLGGEYARRARRLADAGDEAFRLDAAPGGKAQLFWETEPVAQLERGRDPLSPKVQLQRSLDPLSSQDARAVQARLETWLDSQIERRLAALVHLRRDAGSPEVPAQRRALSAQLADALGIAARERLDTVASTLDHACRRAAHKRGVRFGTLDIFLPALLKPEAMLWRAALAATYAGASMPAPPPPGAVTLPTPADTEHRTALGAFGYRIFGGQMLRIDMVERIARKLHEERAKARNFAPDMTLARSMGLQPDSFHRLLADLGFRRAGEGWIWRGRPRRTASTQPSIDNRAFAALAILKEARG